MAADKKKLMSADKILLNWSWPKRYYLPMILLYNKDKLLLIYWNWLVIKFLFNVNCHWSLDILMLSVDRNFQK